MRSIPSHLEIAHFAFNKISFTNGVVIDATCGNGNDTLYLLKNYEIKKLYCFDIQTKALENTKQKLKEEKVCDQSVEYLHECHSKLDLFVNDPVCLIIYNLGYLPTGDKSLTTQTNTTLTSLKKALLLIKPGGLISVTCYPGHDEGEKELKKITLWVGELNQNIYSIYFYQSLNKKAPCLIFISKNT